MTVQVPIDGGRETRGGPTPEWPARGEEHPSVVLGDLAGRRRPDGHAIVFANEKGGVGKSTLAIQCTLALAHRGLRVVAIDCDRRQRTLDRFFEARDGAIRAMRVHLPQPQHVVLETYSAAVLLQEIERVGRDCDFVVIDLAGRDSPVARRAIALADTVVTPVNSSPADLAALGDIHPISQRLRRAGPFADTVIGLREERLARGLPAFDWVVARNRVRGGEKRLNLAADRSLARLSRHLGFRLADGLPERVSYRELLPFGLSHQDLKLLPRLLRPRSDAGREVLRFMETLRLPRPPARAMPPCGTKAAALAQTVERYREVLEASLAVPAAVD
jgi:chromosome partitioning protein